MKMKRLVTFILILLLSPCLFYVSAAENEVIASTSIGDSKESHISLTECFMSISTHLCDVQNDSTITLNWWPWSDQTGSNWPDDDAKSRSGELGVNLTEEESITVINEVENGENISTNHLQIKADMPIVDLSGELQLIEEGDEFRIDIPIVMTPKFNLSDSTIMYIFLSKEFAEDKHGRQAESLVYEMKPEIGFSNQANNTTSVNWFLASSHLAAAGVDFEESPYGWHVTLALFGSLESEETNHLLSLHHVELATKDENVAFDSFLIPIIAIIFAVIIISTVIASMYKEEQGMPIITGYWNKDKSNCLNVQFKTKSKRMEVKSCKVEAPWKLSSNFKSRFIEPEQSVMVELKFKQTDDSDCKLNIRLDVEELGVWSQFLTISSHLNQNIGLSED